MASAKKTKDDDKAKLLPEGFNNLARLSVDGFAKLAPELTIQGRLLGCVGREDGEGDYFAIQLSAPCPAVDYGEETTLDVGQIVGIDAKKGLQELRRFTDRGMSATVYILVMGKRETRDKKRTFWEFVVGTKEKAPPPLRQRKPAAGADDIDDVPFS